MNLIQTLAVAGLFLLAVPRICSQKTYHPNGLTECWITAIEQQRVTAQCLPVTVQEPQEVFGVHQPSDYGTCGILYNH